MKYDYLIVGGGLFGATFAHLAKKHGKRCLVIDRRLTTGGNLYCDNIEGINVHKYGAHIFHTNSKEIWDFVNSFVPFNRYTNSPIANFEGRIYNLPFNMNTFFQMWGVTTPNEAKAIIENQRQDALLKMKQEGVTEPRNLEEQGLCLVGRDIFEKLIKGYTEKQWGRECKDLPSFIIKRLPVRFVYDNNYFNDNYQGIPIGGYNKLIDGLLEGIEIVLNTDFFENREHWESVADRIIFTGKIDQYYNYCFGRLEYRTVFFETEVLDMANYQGNAVVNYTSCDVPYTRIIEHKHFEAMASEVYSNPKTVVSKEYSVEWKSEMEPFYPINDEKNNKIYAQYKSLAEQEEKIVFGGRLAEYKYYDMAPIVRCVFDLAQKEFNNTL